MNSIIISVARNFSWPLSQIKKLSLDNEDVDGLLFWYEDVVRQDWELKNPPSKKPKK